jgi:hypothetical protein
MNLEAAVLSVPMRTSRFWNNLQRYQFFIDGKPIPALPVYVRQDGFNLREFCILGTGMEMNST